MSNEAPTDALGLVLDDYVLVPREPTGAMLKAAFAAMNATPSGTWKRMKAEARHPIQIFNAKMRPRWSAMLAAAPASPQPGGGQCSGISGELDRRIKSEMDFIKDIASNVQRDLAELEDGFSKSQSTAKTDRAVAKMRERCAVLIQCADDALAALPAAPTGDA